MFKDGPGGGATADGPFSHYEATPSAIYAQADAITKQAGDLKSLNGDLTITHRVAEVGVAGALAGPLKTAPKAVEHNASQVMRAAVVGGGCVKYFGNAVTTFNRGVDELNAEYAAAKADDFGVEKPSKPTGKVLPGDVRAVDTFNDDVADARATKLAELKRRYAKFEAKLDAKATKTASMLDKGPDDDGTVLALFGAGVLPIMSTRAFPSVNFKKADWRKVLERFGNTSEAARLLNGSKSYVLQWLKAHPELADAVNFLLKQNGLEMTALERRIVEGQAQLDALTLKDGVKDGDLVKVNDAIARLRLINATAEGGGRVNEAGAAFIDAWLDEVGPDTLTDLPDEVDRRILTPIANAILYRTNGDELESAATDEGTSRTVDELIRTRIGSPSDQGRVWDANGDGEIDGLDRFNGWAKLLSSSTVQGGDEFSQTIGHQAIQARQDMNSTLISIRLATDGYVPDDLKALLNDDDASSDLLSVTARNQDASSRFLIDESDRKALLGLDWNDASGAAEVITAGTDRHGNDGSTLALQRQAAKAVMIDVARNLDVYRGYVGGDETHEGTMQEAISDAVVDLGATWGDTFLNPAAGHHDAQVGPNDIQLSNSDMDRFLQFVGRDDTDDALRFQTGVNLHSQAELTAALRSGDPSAIQVALERAGRFDGAMMDATYEGQVDQLGDKAEAATVAEERSIKAAKIAAHLVKAGGFALGPGGVAAALGSEVVGQVIEGVADDKVATHEYEKDMELNQLETALEADQPYRKNALILAAMKDVTDSNGKPIITQDEIDRLGTQSAAAEAIERYEEDTGKTVKDNFEDEADAQYNPREERRDISKDQAREYEERAARSRYGDAYRD